MANKFKLFRFSFAVFILLSIGLMIFLSAACSTRPTPETTKTDPEIQVIQKQSDGQVLGVAFSPDIKTLASGSFDKTVKLWDAAGGKELHTLQSRSGWIYSTAFSPNGQTLASVSWDKTIELWDVASGKESRAPKAP